MNELQAELAADHPELDIQIVGINEFGQESANDLMTANRNTPWLQDIDSDNNQLSDVWTEWNVTYRDVVIVDAENTELGAFNLTTYNLADANTYTALREILIDVAADQPFWQNRDNRLDVNKDGLVSAQGDVLPCINELNNHFLTDSSGNLPALRLPPIAGEPYIDVNGDGMTTAQADVLPLINFLNSANGGEGEFATSANLRVDGVTPATLLSQAGLSPNTTSAVVLPDSWPISSVAAGSGTGALTFDGRTANVSAQFVATSVAHDSNALVSPSADAPVLLAATVDQRDAGSTSASRTAQRQDSHEPELNHELDDNDELDDLDALAADVAAVWSLP